MKIYRYSVHYLLGAWIFCFALSSLTHAAATTPNPGLKYYYPAPDAPVVDVEADIIIYGGTSGGVVAAVQAARQGNSVALVVFGRHVGGMTSGGLTQTDGVNETVQGGITREYFDIVGNTGFKPSEAETAFETFLADPVPGADWDGPIPTYYEQRLEWVEKEGTQIVALHMENGSIYRGRMFLDCTYEGDLMAMAGVPYAYGRESRDQYGEYLAGRKSSVAIPGVDAYTIPGDPSSGLIYNLILGETEGTVGQADAHVQAYNFRMYTTWNDKQPLWEPSGYNPENFELLYRYHKNGGDTRLSVGNDINNHEMFNRGVSTDHIGGNRWPDGEGGYVPWWEADYATRELIFQSHIDWQLGMLWYVKTDPDYAALTTDPSVGASQQAAIQEAINRANALGLPLGEYPETKGWPHELYIREARRMVSDFVATQAHYDRQVAVPDSVGLANYRADAHHSRRFAAPDGTVRVEGDTGGHDHTPWQIPYRSLVPPKTNTTNLLVPWCISASHVAFCSMRMEPCFMVLSQSAATAAGLALQEGIPVQDVDYADLKLRLDADGQILGDVEVASNELIIDNADAEHVEIIGSWLVSSSTPGGYNNSYLHDQNSGTGKSVTFRPNLEDEGSYEVYLNWTSFENRATNAPVQVTHANGTAQLSVNQRTDGAQWNRLGTWTFNAGTDGSVTLGNDGADGYVIADAVRFVNIDEPATNSVHIFVSNPHAEELNGRPARIQILRTSEFYTAPLSIDLSIEGTAVPGTHYTALPATVTIPAGKRAADLWVYPISDDIAQGTRSVIVRVASNQNYTINGDGFAEVSIVDKPADDWRFRKFEDSGSLETPASEPRSDPDQDGRINLLERYFDTDPMAGTHDSESEPKLISMEVEGRSWSGLIWSRSGDAQDLGASVQFQAGLGADDWSNLPTGIETLEWTQTTGARRFRHWMDTTDYPQLFFRLVVDQ